MHSCETKALDETIVQIFSFDVWRESTARFRIITHKLQ